MSQGFSKAFDDFLNERIGEDIAKLRAKNEKYSAALAEYSELIRRAENDTDMDYKRDFIRLAELITCIRDTEYRYLYYAGMAAGRQIDKAISSITFGE